MTMLVPTTSSLFAFSKTKRYSRSNGSRIFPAKLRTEMSMSWASVSSSLGRLTVLSTAARRLRLGKSALWTSRKRYMA